MMKYFSIFFSLLISIQLSAQDFSPPTKSQLESAPNWAKLMYNESTKISVIDRLYKEYMTKNGHLKDVHTRYYKFWRRSVIPRIDSDGTIIPIAEYEKLLVKQLLKKEKELVSINKKSRFQSGNWQSMGPTTVYNRNLIQDDEQFVASAIDVSDSNPDIVYIGTEPGGVYKSLNGGDSWINIGFDLEYSTPYGVIIEDIAIHPTNPDIVFFSSSRQIFRTVDGGITWDLLFTSMAGFGIGTQKIFINPSNTNTILVATREGMMRSDDSGLNWITVFDQHTYDIAVHPTNNNVIYALRINENTTICEFIKSVDNGLTFNVESNGWYSSIDPNRQVLGGRIAVTPANPDMVYAFIIGQTEEGDKGQIGLLRSMDSGENWAVRGQIGGPYNGTSEKNLVTVSPDGGGFYGGLAFLDMVVSSSDPNKLLIGSLNLFTSSDGGLSFESLGGYSGGILSSSPQGFMVDQREFINSGETTWIGNDGGIYRSDDFFDTENFSILSTGINSSELWGFGMGWNKDIMISGVYHNGNIVMNENYPSEHVVHLGGGEPATGYVNPGTNNMVYSTDVGVFFVPDDIAALPENIQFNFFQLNESINQEDAISNLTFHPTCYSIAYAGKDHQLWKTEDKGISFDLVHAFGTNFSDKVSDVKISRENTDIIFACQRMDSTEEIKLWKSDDGGQNWSSVDLPETSLNTDKAVIEVDPYNENNLWYMNRRFGGLDLFKTTNGGLDWQQLNTDNIDTEFYSINYIPGTNGGIYIGTVTGMYYKNDSMDNFELYNQGFPATIAINRVRPFYRDGEVRAATSKGYWRSDFRDEPSRSFAHISVDKLVQTEDNESFHFVDHSMLDHENATWEWSFEDGTPSTSNHWEQTVSFSNTEQHEINLTITDKNGFTDTHTIFINEDSLGVEDVVKEDSVYVYPNPVTPGGNLNLVSDSNNKIDVKIYSIGGKIIHQLIAKPNTQILIPNLSQGLYVLRLNNGVYIKNEIIIVK
ncbi:MAG: T9SS type A sorting domain-containing protein [Psychroserpens sp.]|nr:T9SS type A sorting domain-containing protein [Psychroserpens sp.]